MLSMIESSSSEAATSETTDSQCSSADSQDSNPTQPLLEVDEVDAWATLMPRMVGLPTVQLTLDSTLVGRDRCKAKVVIDEFFISRKHFTIERALDDEHAAFIVNHSGDKSYVNGMHGGTYVNGNKIELGRKHPLLNGDTLALANVENVCYEFSMKSAKSEEDRHLFPLNLTTKYIMGRKLGSGGNGAVYLAYAKNCPHDTFQKFAIKEVKTHGLSGSVDGTYKEEEADIWRDLSHPCIIKFYEHIETPYANYFVLELAEGGELFEYVLDDHKNQTSNERAAKVQFYQILRALDYLHVDSTICHRDLKLENILLMTKNKAGRIKITDFGLSRAATGTMNSYVGTPYYIAPEVVRNEDIPNRLAYTVKADVWSAGCILYSLLCGGQAFTGSDKQVKKDILKGRYSMSDGSWEDRSAECKNLVAKMLTGDPEMRPTAWEALNHPWFVDDPHLVHEAELVMSGKKEAANLDVPRSMSVTGDLGIVYTSLAFSLGL